MFSRTTSLDLLIHDDPQLYARYRAALIRLLTQDLTIEYLGDELREVQALPSFMTLLDESQVMVGTMAIQRVSLNVAFGGTAGDAATACFGLRSSQRKKIAEA